MKQNGNNYGCLASAIFSILMIGAYFIGWKTLFYIGVIPLLVLEVFIVGVQIKYGNWKLALVPFLTLVITSEIGYLITKKVIDGICIGLYLMIISGAIQYLFTNKKKDTEEEKL